MNTENKARAKNRLIPAERDDDTAISPAPITPAPRRLSRGARLAISAAVIFHLVAVVAAPFSAIPDTESPAPDEGDPSPTGQLSHRVARGLQWYIQPLFLNHGYRFFAPDPGPSDTIRCELELDDGRQLIKTYPKLEEQWPRLLYHRHFMLTSRLAGGAENPVALEYANAYARHLAEKYGARTVRVFYVRHDLPERLKVMSGTNIKDSSLYITMPDPRPSGTWRGTWNFPRLAQGAGDGRAAEGRSTVVLAGGDVPAEHVPQGRSEEVPTRPGLLARPPEGVTPFPPGVATEHRIELQIQFDARQQIPGEPLFGNAELRGLPTLQGTVHLNWKSSSNEGMQLWAIGSELPPLLAYRIGANELLLRMPTPHGELLTVLQRDELPLAEYRRQAE